MKIALIGYGKMGKAIEEVILEQKKHNIVSVSYKDKNSMLDLEGIKRSDVAIDFTSAEVIVKNIQKVAKLGVNIVVGTTGWYNDLERVQKIVKNAKIGFIYAQNFSIGANVFFQITAYASKAINRYSGYDVFGIETHHTGKKDSPSGTARKLANIIMQNYPKKTKLQLEKLDRQIEEEELHFVSVRGGRNFGRHEIIFDSDADEIRLSHQAWGRRGFAQGAVLAAEFIDNKKGFYNFSDIFNEKQSVSKNKISKERR
ncbi:MAG: 4-hydroxy-tetrahydrodipicolinate reductase [Candidatus Levybacteria bacterium]|nr:4-hydroxy-tetrahydrodipicolinate reductase [Candidatus Levybacteria bacterium]